MHARHSRSTPVRPDATPSSWTDSAVSAQVSDHVGTARRHLLCIRFTQLAPPRLTKRDTVVPLRADRTVSDGNSGMLTVTNEHALTWPAAAPTTVRRSLPSW